LAREEPRFAGLSEDGGALAPRFRPRALRQFVQARGGFAGFVECDERECGAMFRGQAAAVVAPAERHLERVVGFPVDRGDTGLIRIGGAERIVVGG
jgi:hypothetical protein